MFLFSFISIILLSFLATAEICSPVTMRKNIGRYQCNSEGLVTDADPLGDIQILEGANADINCRNNCLDNSYCQSYSFNPNTTQCQMYTKSPGDQMFKKASTNNFFTNRLCYVQNFTTAPGFVNPGFDSPKSKFLQPWSRVGSNNYLPRRKASGYQSPYAALLSVGTQINQTVSEVKQTFYVCPNITYTITPYYKYLGANGTSLSKIRTTFNNINGAFGSSCFSIANKEVKPGNATGEWTPFTIETYRDCYSETEGECNDPNCDCYDPPLIEIPYKLGIAAGAVAGAFQMIASAGYPKESDQYPILDNYLVDFVVERSVTTIDRSSDGSCGLISQVSDQQA